jgi:hypothetical protein
MTDQQPRANKRSLVQLWVRSNVITTVLIIFILLSLLLHAVTIGALLRVRGIINSQLELSLVQLAELRQQKIRYTFPVDQTVLVDTTVAISETVRVPISITVPISQTVSVPVGPVSFDVPLDFTVPVSDTVDIPINKQLPFQAEVPIKVDIPVDLDLGVSPLGDVIQEFEDALRDLHNRL